MGEPVKAFGVNLGILGHVDSGKTSLCKALAVVCSTASMDKHPQSQERGITLDLGFSSFTAPAPERFVKEGYDLLQFCLVDCPGHASLIKTIIGGAQIIDLLCLVIDVTKGIQTQTAECLVLAEILAPQMIVVLNKVDQFPEDQRAKKVESMTTRLRKVFAKTRFGADLPMVPVAVHPADGEPIGLKDLMGTIGAILEKPVRNPDAGGFYFAFDHCFQVKGQGTVMTGTVLSGTVKVNDTVLLPVQGVTKKVKGLQMFRKPVQKAVQGDRVAVCIPGLEAQNLERGIVVDSKAVVPTFDGCICVVEKIQYFKGSIKSKAKFHVTVGHETVMASAVFFTRAGSEKQSGVEQAGSTLGVGALVKSNAERWPTAFDFSWESDWSDELVDEPNSSRLTFAFLTFETPVTCPVGSLLIGSKLDVDVHTPQCRLAFYGRIIADLNPKKPEVVKALKVVKVKKKEGRLDRVDKQDKRCVIIRDLFQKEADCNRFIGLKVTSECCPESGTIEGSFGKGSKMRVTFPSDVAAETDAKGNVTGSVPVFLHFKKFVFDSSVKFSQ